MPIERGSGERGLLIGFDEVRLLLDPYAFTTEVFFEPDAVSIWLSELQLYGRGATFEDAQADLVDEVNAYVEEFLSDARLYLRSPNRAAHFPWILRAYVANAAGDARRRAVRGARGRARAGCRRLATTTCVGSASSTGGRSFRARGVGREITADTARCCPTGRSSGRRSLTDAARSAIPVFGGESGVSS